jgi:hypothetical protein
MRSKPSATLPSTILPAPRRAAPRRAAPAVCSHHDKIDVLPLNAPFETARDIVGGILRFVDFDIARNSAFGHCRAHPFQHYPAVFSQHCAKRFRFIVAGIRSDTPFAYDV